MTFWQLTVDCTDPARLTAFWGFALGYVPTPPAEPTSTWQEHYRARLGGESAFDNPADLEYFTVLQDPGDNEFCVS
ncbi:hypothetical protein MM440_08740 [Arsenicicoccus piscis]|uniref:Glyoxalase-like domain-containing protein n=1 Tax=Arsenicicoccus piscis TaxID=673954 RepID=A0ABQ6HIR9_9MICO|nr:VOC family protein [Arsenicicoccus piscis]MCH8627870.1 hypothetical protein [Arsenicicoccus piscis]GMA18403.1 hypothetical protein GCM10025862_04240 [Arsenicicoccus piscis]